MPPTGNNSSDQVDRSPKTPKSFYNLEEVSKHCSVEDCWLTVYDGVYDVTPFIKEHPGGKAIVGFAGSDATLPFYMTHKSALSVRMLNKHRIGTLKDYTPSPIIQGYKTMTDDFKRKGYFEFSKTFLILHLIEIFSLTFLGYWVWKQMPGFFGATLGAIIAAFATGQGGWLMHDLGHFSVFRSTQTNRIVQLLLMNVWLGGSHSYWRNAHWKHHLFTNIEGWDHDIDTLPLFAWSKKMFAKLPSPFFGSFQEYYWYFLGPATSFWYILYLGYTYYMRRKNYWMELLGNTIHYTAIYFLVGQSITYTILAKLYIFFFLGLYMGHIFSLSHFPMEIIDKTEKRAPGPVILKKVFGVNLIQHQLRTTRDVEPNWFVDYFSGHLNYQIEHHIWPLMPRHNLPKVQPIFREFCKQHDLPYQIVPFGRAFVDVFETLHSVQTAYWEEISENSK